MLNTSVLPAFIAVIILSALCAGCNNDPSMEVKPVAPVQVASASTQPSAPVAELAGLKISRRELDQFLYESYGLRLVFDLVEMNLAKNTLEQTGVKLMPADVQRERAGIISNIVGDAPQSDYENLFDQFLQREKLSRAEFDLKIVETNAYLRKIIEPIVVGKLPEDKIHRAFEQLYGAKRVIQDITVHNTGDASIARERLKTEPFSKVALDMSLDRETAVNGGEWPAFSSQSKEIPEAILEAAFSSDPGQISDILETGSTFHIIKVVQAIPPDARIAKYADEHDNVRHQLEQKLIEADMKRLREGLREKAQTQVVFDDPILRAKWDELVAKSRSRSTDPKTVHQQLDDQMKSATRPTTAPAGTVPVTTAPRK